MLSIRVDTISPTLIAPPQASQVTRPSHVTCGHTTHSLSPACAVGEEAQTAEWPLPLSTKPARWGPMHASLDPSTTTQSFLCC